jgi:hypothetical protein
MFARAFYADLNAYVTIKVPPLYKGGIVFSEH